MFEHPHGLRIDADDNIWATDGVAHGHAGRILKLDLNSKLLGAAGSQGKTLGQYGEAHFMTMSAKGDIFVADSLNWRVQRLVKR